MNTPCNQCDRANNNEGRLCSCSMKATRRALCLPEDFDTKPFEDFALVVVLAVVACLVILRYA